jgi:hypothetical protein
MTFVRQSFRSADVVTTELGESSLGMIKVAVG